MIENIKLFSRCLKLEKNVSKDVPNRKCLKKSKDVPNYVPIENIEEISKMPEINDQKSTIPKDWRWVRLGEVCEIIMGQSPPGDTYSKKGKGAKYKAL